MKLLPDWPVVQIESSILDDELQGVNGGVVAGQWYYRDDDGDYSGPYSSSYKAIVQYRLYRLEKICLRV